MLVFTHIRLPGVPSGGSDAVVAGLEQAWMDTSSSAEEVPAAEPAADAAEPKYENVWEDVVGDEKEPAAPEGKWAGWEDDWDDEVDPTQGLASSSSSSTTGNKGCKGDAGKGGGGRGAFRGGYGGGHYDSEHSRMQVFEADHRLQVA